MGNCGSAPAPAAGGKALSVEVDESFDSEVDLKPAEGKVSLLELASANRATTPSRKVLKKEEQAVALNLTPLLSDSFISKVRAPPSARPPRPPRAPPDPPGPPDR